MKLKLIQDENFQDYGFAISMLIACEKCDYKCAADGRFSLTICQNSHLAQMPTINLTNEQIYERYKPNPLTTAIIFGGMEPFLQFEEIFDLISFVRLQGCSDLIIIYTGYYPQEIAGQLEQLKTLPNIIVKFGRYKPNQEPHFDECLGVVLANKEQWGEKIS
jgi:pyruvate-formate lyase-activating enzyme